MRALTPAARPAPGPDAVPGPLPRLSRAPARAARRHWMLVALLAAGLALRVVTQVAYRPALLYIDSPKYIVPSLYRYDPVGYRFLLLDPVTWAGNLAVVAAVQHLLGLAMAAVLYVLAIRRGAPRWAAALAAAPLLLDAYQIQMEQNVMPDVLFEALIVAALAVLVWKPRPSPAAVAVAAFLLGVSATVRQVGEVLVVPVLAFAVLAARGRRGRLAAGGVALVSFAVPILAYMTWSAAAVGGGFQLSDEGDAVLYGRVAAAADCATLRVPARLRPFCPPPETVKSFGIDGLVNNPRSPQYTAAPPPGLSRPQAVSRFSSSVLGQQPLRVAGAIGRDAVKVFALTRHGSPGDPPIWRWQFYTRYPLYPPTITSRTARILFRMTGGGAGPAADRPLAVFLRAYQFHGGYTPGPYLLVALLAGAAGVACAWRGRDRVTALTCLLITGTGVVVLLGADAYEFSWRYQLPALVTLPVAAAIAVGPIAAQARRAADRAGRLLAQGRLGPQ